MFFPLIALITALLPMGGRRDPGKRSQLRSWAWVSGGLLVFESVVLLLLASVTL